MKRRINHFSAVYVFVGFLLGVLVFGSSAAIAAGIMAQPKTAEIFIDGRPVDLKGYLIEDSHYFQLRDLVEKLIPSGKDFGVIWDGENKRVLIDTTVRYAPETTEPQATTGIDYSLQANPAIFDDYYTREKYNKDRQLILDTGTYVNWGSNRVPQSTAAINASNSFLNALIDMSEFDKVQSISDFVCSHITYSANAAFNGNDFWTGTAYGICEDYARMFQYLCYRAGIPCVFVTGVTDGNGHGWNEVYIGREWLFYDGNLSDIRQSIALGESAKRGHTYTDDNSDSTRYRKEVFIPGSTL